MDIASSVVQRKILLQSDIAFRGIIVIFGSRLFSFETSGSSRNNSMHRDV